MYKTEPNEPIASNEVKSMRVGMPEYWKDFEKIESKGGLTKREHFAGLAMQGIMSSEHYYGITDQNKAEFAVIMSDLLIAELNKPKP